MCVNSTALHGRPTHDPAIDTFKVEYLVGPSVVLALIFNYEYSLTEVLWAFSVYLESVAILPQLFMLQRTGEAETITTHYLAALGAYRALYIPNWIYRYVTIPHLCKARHLTRRSCRYFTEGKIDPIAVTSGIVQTGLYLDFFYVYFTKYVTTPKITNPRTDWATEYYRARSSNCLHEKYAFVTYSTAMKFIMKKKNIEVALHEKLRILIQRNGTLALICWSISTA